MKSLLILMLLAGTSLAHSATSSESCFLCQFDIPEKVSKKEEALACEDLHSAACLRSDGSMKKAGASAALEKDLTRIVENARLDSLKQMGYSSLGDALKKRLADADLHLNEDFDPLELKTMLRNPEEFFSSGGTEIFRGPAECATDLEDIQAMDPEAEGVQMLMAADKMKEKYKNMNYQNYATNIPNFVTEHIGQKCLQIKENRQVYSRKQNKEIYETCRKFPLLKKEAELIYYRLEGTPEYKEKALAFVRKYALPDLSSPAVPVDILSSLRAICDGINQQVAKKATTVIGNLLVEAQTNKVMVDKVVDSFYNDKNYSLANQIFEQSRGDVKDLVDQMVKSPQKKNKILSSFDQTKLYWMEKPAASAYVKGKDGLLRLDESQAAPKFIRDDADDTYAFFSDPTLQFFTQLNANYMPKVGMGDFVKSERVNMMPGFLHMMHKNPYSFMSVVAHEIGHKIGPELSRINGADLSGEYQDLLKCYRQNNSIKMNPDQADETISDYISSQVLAYQISKLPREKQKAALFSAMQDFCLFTDSDLMAHGVSCHGDHPASSLRVGGIYGSNPNIREILGCEKDSKTFATCGLNIKIRDGEKNRLSTPLSQERSSQ